MKRCVTYSVIWVLLALASAAKPQGAPLLRVEPGGHTAEVRQVLFLPGGRELISAGKDKVIRVWDIATGRHHAIRFPIGPGVQGQVFCAALGGPNASLLAAGLAGDPARKDKPGDILLFESATGKLLRRLIGQTGTVSSVAFSPDGSRLASTGAGTVRVWNVPNGGLVWEKKLEKRLPSARGRQETLQYYTYSAAFSPDGGRVAAGSVDGAVRIWQANDGKELQKVDFGSEVLSVAWSSRGVLACGTRDGVIRVWDPRGADEPVKLPKLADAVTCLAFSPQGDRLVSGTGEGGTDFTARVWSIPDGRPVSRFEKHETTVFTAAWAPDGAAIATGDAYGEICVWDPASGGQKQILAGSGSSAFSVAWSADGKQVAWSERFQGPLSRAFDLSRGLPALAVDPAAPWVRGERSRGGRTLAMSPDGAALLLRDAAGKELGRVSPQPGDQIKSYLFAPDGRIIVGSDLYLQIIDPSGGKGRTLEGHQGSVLALAVSPDGRFLASGSADQTVRIWDLRVGAPDVPLLSVFTDAQGEWVAWTEPGYYAASPNGDEMIGWHVNRGPDRNAEFYSAYQFRKTFYRPDVVRQVLTAGSVKQALQLADANRPQQTDETKTAANIARIAPPAVQILSPADGSETGEQEITVRAKLEDPTQKADLRLKVNGASRNLKVIAAQGAPGERILTARLMPGENVISVVSFNESGESAPAQVRVRCIAPKPQLPRLYMLVIGVSQYENSKITPLSFAADDARAFSALYGEQKDRMFSDVYSRVLLDRGATSGTIKEALKWIRDEAKEGDYAVVFVAGHGFVQDGRYYFAPANADPERLSESGVAWSEVVEAARDLPCRVLFAIDTCHSGGVNVEVLRDPYNTLLRQSKEAGLITLSACMPGELSFEDPQWKHGAFTFALLDALKGRAGTEEDGSVPLIQVAAYVNREVSRLTNRRQTSKLHADPNIPDNLPLARVK